jgi:hypothetical protein
MAGPWRAQRLAADPRPPTPGEAEAASSGTPAFPLRHGRRRLLGGCWVARGADADAKPNWSAAPKDQWSLASSTWAVALAIGGGARQGIAQAEAG